MGGKKQRMLLFQNTKSYLQTDTEKYTVHAPLCQNTTRETMEVCDETKALSVLLTYPRTKKDFPH